MEINQLLTKDQLRDLLEPSDMKGWLDVLTSWTIISFAFALSAFYPHPLSYLVSMILLGGRQLALAILMHDTSHYATFKTRWLNDWVGSWLCAYPVWQHLKRYREHHLRHHQFAGSERDPDISLVEGFPISKGSLFRKFLRDLTGISGIKRIYGLILMDLGYIHFTAASDVRKIENPQNVVSNGLRNMHGVVITNFILFAVLWLLGQPQLYLLWVGGYLIFFSLFVRIRSIAEHACTEMDLDPTKNTRTTWANPLARLTVAPHHVNFHLEHHLLMTVPSYNLRRFHGLLVAKNAYEHGHYSPGYLHVLKTATK